MAKFTPIKVKDMWKDCMENGLHIYKDHVKAGSPLITYQQFLHIIRTMEKAGYNITSGKQIDQLKRMLADISK